MPEERHVGDGVGHGPAIDGPYLDLRTGRGNQLAYARIQGDLEFGRQKYYWFKGHVMANRPGSPIEDLFGAQGFGVIRLNQREDGVIERMCRQIGMYTDRKTGEVLSEWHNPYIDETVNVVHVSMDAVNFTIEEYFPAPPNYGPDKEAPPRVPFVLPWYQHGDWIEMQMNVHMGYPNPLQPDEWPRESAGSFAQVSELFTHHVKADDMQNPKITSLDYRGSWSRITPWLPWMLMGQQPGHCSFLALMSTCEHPGDVLSRSVVDYAEKHLAQFFDAPDTMDGERLSDLQLYALQQKPAPAST